MKTQPIGIIGAMDEEISMYLKSLENKREHKWNIFTFCEGTMHGKNVVVVKSGVGKVFSAMVCQRLIDEYKVCSVIFTGVGGSLNKTLEIGDVVVSTDSCHHDFDAQLLGFKRGQISYTNYRFFAAEKKLVELALSAKLEGHKIIAGRILTGDQFMTHKDKQDRKYLFDELHGDCIEMEGASVAQVCTMNNVPHIIIRSVSDKADGSAVVDYDKFKSVVSENSFKIVDSIIMNVNKKNLGVQYE